MFKKSLNCRASNNRPFVKNIVNVSVIKIGILQALVPLTIILIFLLVFAFKLQKFPIVFGLSSILIYKNYKFVQNILDIELNKTTVPFSIFCIINNLSSEY